MPAPRKSKSWDVLQPRSPKKAYLNVGRSSPKKPGPQSPKRFYSPLQLVKDSSVSEDRKVGDGPTSAVKNAHAETLFPDSSCFEAVPSILLRENAALLPDTSANHVAVSGEVSSTLILAYEDSRPLSRQPTTNRQEILFKTPEELTDLSLWGLPEKVVAAYRKCGITHMFSWQAKCLSVNNGNVLDGGNLVYSAPTSAGKTLVAEILLLKRVIETKKKGLFILPFVALAREKMTTLQRMFKGTGVRVGGYIGHIHPPGGLKLLDVAVCTIEKANSLINRLVNEKKLHQLGVIVVDELHMVGDRGRGYLIELLLTKVRYLNRRRKAVEEMEEGKVSSGVQIIGMSATLPNLDTVQKWLEADLYTSDFRPIPLTEYVKVGPALFDKSWTKLREITLLPTCQNDPDHIVSLCHETVEHGQSVLVFCPSKTWCETVAQVVSTEFNKLKLVNRADFIQTERVQEIIDQLKQCPAALDGMLEQTVPSAVAFHHAGLTADEREIIESGFRKCVIKVLVATTTLSSGVNLPARRVIIRSPFVFDGGQSKPIDSLTYYQMAGRAGRKGVDTEGESILICKDIPKEKSTVNNLFTSSMRPVQSCLAPGSRGEPSMTIIRAVLEIIVNGAARTVAHVKSYMECAFFACSLDESALIDFVSKIIESLKSSQFILVQRDGETLAPSQLGNAVVWSGLSPSEGKNVFQELEKARTQFNLENELHLLYLVTPLNIVHSLPALDYYHYIHLWESLPSNWKRVGNLVGVDEAVLALGVRNRLNDDASFTQVARLRRFYCALMLNELAHEVPLPTVAKKYQCNKGIAQSLQQGASSYSGMVTVFCEELGWSNMAMLFEQFQSRLMFGVRKELVELVKIQYLTARQARVLYEGGYPNLTKLAIADRMDIAEILRDSVPFESDDADVRNAARGKRNVLLNGLDALTDAEAAEVVITEARRLLEADMEAAGFILATKSPKKPAIPIDVEKLSENASSLNHTVAEYQEIQSSQAELDAPLDDELNAANQIILTQQRSEKSSQKPSDSALRSPAKQPRKSLPLFDCSPVASADLPPKSDAGSSGSRDNPDRLSPAQSSQDSRPVLPQQRCNSQEDLFSAAETSEVISYCSSGERLPSQVVISSCSSAISSTYSTQEAGEVSIEPCPSLQHLPSVLESEFQELAENWNTVYAPGTAVKAALEMEMSETPVPVVSVRSHGGDDSTPVLFSSPARALKRKLLSASEGGERVKVSRRDSVGFDVLPKINFDGEEIDLDVVPSSLPGTPEPERVASRKSICAEKKLIRVKALETEAAAMQSKTVLLEGLEVVSEEPPTVSPAVVNAAADVVSQDIDKGSFDIVEVPVTVAGFADFMEKWAKQKHFSLCLACEKLEKDLGRQIGPARAGPQKAKIANGIPVPLENASVVGLSVSWNGKTAYFVPFSDQSRSSSSLLTCAAASVSAQARAEAAGTFLRGLVDVTVVIFDFKRQFKLLTLALGVTWPKVQCYDPKVADWMLDMGSGEKSLQTMVAEKIPTALGILSTIQKHRGAGSLGLATSSALSPRVRSGTEAVVARLVMPKLLNELQTRNMLDVFKLVEMPVLGILTGMELNGFGFSVAEGKRLKEIMLQQMGMIERKAYDLAGRKFVLTSPDSVGQILFVELRIPPPPEAIQTRNSRGKVKVFYTTNKDILSKIQSLHEMPMLVMEHRRLQHAFSTVVEPIEKQVVKDIALQMHRIHGYCCPNSVTGRVGMADPSLQAIPKDFAVDQWEQLSQKSSVSAKKGRRLAKKLEDKVSVSLRTAFVPFSGGVLLSADYSQLELRILAHLSDDKKLIEALSCGGDVLKIIASQWKKICPEQVSDDERQQAKKICYGMIYGMGARTLAEQLDVTDIEARDFMETFRSAYPAVRQFMSKTVELCRQRGYVETLSGNRRYLPHINSSKYEQRSQAERVAVNTTVQGSATNLAKSALVKIEQELHSAFPNRVFHMLNGKKKPELQGGYLVLQLHDEFIFEVCPDDLAKVAEIVERCMKTAIRLRVPVEVKMRTGPSWGGLKPYDLPR